MITYDPIKNKYTDTETGADPAAGGLFAKPDFLLTPDERAKKAATEQEMKTARIKREVDEFFDDLMARDFLDR